MLQYSSGSAAEYGDYNCNIPEQTLEIFLQQVQTLQPDFVIFSGEVHMRNISWDPVNSRGSYKEY